MPGSDLEGGAILSAHALQQCGHSSTACHSLRLNIYPLRELCINAEMIDISGRTAFITGGAHGVGLSIARALAAAGAKLALVDVDRAALGRAKSELEATVPVAIADLDVRDRKAFGRVADDLEASVGPISLLINSARVTCATPTPKLTYELWDRVIGVNLMGVVNSVQTLLPRMLARGGGGHIVNTTSRDGFVGVGSNALYCTSKFGVVGLSESLRNELSDRGVGVSIFCTDPAQDVGEHVLSAVRHNRLHIYTDRSLATAITERGKAILVTA